MLIRFVLLFFCTTSLVQAGKLTHISQVAFDSETAKPGHFIYYGTTDAVMTGLFGWAAASGGMAPDKEGAEIEARLRAAGFDVSKVLRDDFTKALRARTVFTSLSGGSHTLRLDITRYGLGVAPTGFKRLKPVLEATVTVRDASFKQVYFLRRSVSNTDDFVRGQSIEEYREHLEWLQRDFRVLTVKMAERLTEALEKERKGTATPPTSSSKSASESSSHRFAR